MAIDTRFLAESGPEIFAGNELLVKGCLEIDGGVHRENLAEVVRAGCDWIVTGSAVFHSPDPEATVREMREIAVQATAVRC